jgi:hypothetical protein
LGSGKDGGEAGGLGTAVPLVINTRALPRGDFLLKSGLWYVACVPL